MKLRSKIFIVTDASGNEINAEDKKVVLSLNGERLETTLQDVCSDLEFDDGEIYGNTLLSYYGINPDGSLEVEGSKIQLLDAETGEPILIKEIKRPTVHDDTNIPFEHVQKFVEYFKVAKPDEVFDNLNTEEKQAFIDARISADNTKQAEEASRATQKAQADAEAAKQAEAALKASIDPTKVNENKDYISIQGFYSGIDFKEYIKDNLHLFYGQDENNMPCILIKRGKDWWEELQEPVVLDETDTSVELEYLDGEVTKRLTLDIPTGEIVIEA